MQPHVVYLANSSGIKVGITRQSQIPTRWIDQGAIQAVPVFLVSSRYLSGLIETVFKQHISDRTNWRTMLKNEVEAIDLLAQRNHLVEVVRGEIDELKAHHGEESIRQITDDNVFNFNYPAISWPAKIKSHNLDKTPLVEGMLLAIKGQYLILDSGCLNIRKYSSYHVKFSIQN
jgi:hypothetical protein